MGKGDKSLNNRSSLVRSTCLILCYWRHCSPLSSGFYQWCVYSEPAQTQSPGEPGGVLWNHLQLHLQTRSRHLCLQSHQKQVVSLNSGYNSGYWIDTWLLNSPFLSKSHIFWLHISSHWNITTLAPFLFPDLHIGAGLLPAQFQVQVPGEWGDSELLQHSLPWGRPASDCDHRVWSSGGCDRPHRNPAVLLPERHYRREDSGMQCEGKYNI